MTQDQYWETLEATVQSSLVSLDWTVEVGGQAAAQSHCDHAPDLVADVRRTWERVCCKARQLSERERLVLDLELRQGVCPVEVARRLNVTKSRVSQLRSRAITHLREAVGTSCASLLPGKPSPFGHSPRNRAQRAITARPSLLLPLPCAARAPQREHRTRSSSLKLDLVVATTARAILPAASSAN
jgi:hypothetical protein